MVQIVSPPSNPTPVAQPVETRSSDAFVPGRRRGRWVALLAAVAVVNAALGVGALILHPGGGDPETWDGRVTDLVAFVERERGLRFKHPVRIDFLDDGEFREQATAHEELNEEDRAELEATEALLRAVGLASGDLDLESVGEELVGDGTVGLYEPETKRIAVRGKTLDNERRITLVHELTHALQDQHFAIGEMEPETSGAQAALIAVIEADAEAVAEAWRQSLPSAARDALDSSEEATSEEADFEGVPEVLVELMGSPYALGPGFLDAVIAARGEAGRDELLRRPPTT
ncbi:MAG: hypothetical protein M3Q48_05350, partial [Actinomycetota bacterium]|nr:hypothetical protein [Actinomycetota bacterium]